MKSVGKGGMFPMLRRSMNSLLVQILAAVIAAPMVAWAGGGGTGWIDAGRFALIVQFGAGLSVIFLAWIIKEKLNIKIPKLIQAPIIWIAAFIVFRVILQPPIPFTLLAIYMGV